MPTPCQQATKEYEELTALKEQFDLEFKKEATGFKVKALMAEIIRKRDALKTKFLQYKYEKFDRRHLASVERKEKYEVKDVIEGHAGWVLTLQVLPDGRIVSGGRNGAIKIWQKEQGKYQVKETLEGHADWVYTLQVLPDGRIVSGGSDKTIRIWNGKHQ